MGGAPRATPLGAPLSVIELPDNDHRIAWDIESNGVRVDIFRSTVDLPGQVK